MRLPCTRQTKRSYRPTVPGVHSERTALRYSLFTSTKEHAFTFLRTKLKKLDYSRNVLKCLCRCSFFFFSFFLSFFLPSPWSDHNFDIPPTRTERKEEPIIISAPNDGVWKWLQRCSCKKPRKNSSACLGESALPAKMRKTSHERHERGQFLNHCHISVIHIIKSAFTTADESVSSHTGSILFPPKKSSAVKQKIISKTHTFISDDIIHIMWDFFATGHNRYQ